MITRRNLFAVSAAAILLASCGDSSVRRLHTPAAATSDIVINVTQNNDAPWTAAYEKGPRSTLGFFPLGETIALRLSANEDGHILSIPEFGISLPGRAGQTSQSWFNVTKAVTVTVQCENHPEEKTGLTLQFK